MTILSMTVIFFSDDMSSHAMDLSRVLGKLSAAGFTLRGSKCFFLERTVCHTWALNIPMLG